MTRRIAGTTAGRRIGYARVSTQGQDLTAQRNALRSLGVADDDVFVDHGVSGSRRTRPGLQAALDAAGAGDTLVVAKVDRLSRSVRDTRDIVDELTDRGVVLNVAGADHDPDDPVARLLLNVLSVMAEFEADMIRTRTREGMAVARAAGRLRGKPPKLDRHAQARLVGLHRAAGRTPTELARLFGVGRATVYRVLRAAGDDVG